MTVLEAANSVAALGTHDVHRCRRMVVGGWVVRAFEVRDTTFRLPPISDRRRETMARIVQGNEPETGYSVA